MKTILFLLLVNIIHNAQNTIIIKGLIYDEKTGDRLTGVTISKDNTLLAVSDSNGFYEFKTNNNISVKFRLLGYEEKPFDIILGDNLEEKLIIYLKPQPIELNFITVSGEQFSEIYTSSSYTIQPGDLTKIPQFGEVDAFRAFLALPGITNTSDFSSQLSLRGGNYDETLIVLDEVPVYNPYHLSGVFSMFNNDILKNEKLYFSNYPLNYSGYLSGVLELNSKNGNNEGLKGNISLGIASTKLALDGPLLNGTFSLSLRRTYMDIISKLFKANFPYYFYDIYAKYSFRLSKKNNISLSGFHSKDIYNIENENATQYINQPIFYDKKDDPNWGNYFLNFSSDYFISDKSSIELKMFYTKAFIGLDTGVRRNEINTYLYDTSYVNNYIDDLTGKIKLHYFHLGHQLVFGFETKRMQMSYNWSIDESDLGALFIKPLESIFYDQADNPFNYYKSEYIVSFYLTDLITLSKGSKVEAGLRLNYLGLLNEFIILPRVNCSTNLSSNLKFHLGYSKSYQNTYTMKEQRNDATFSPFTVSFLSQNRNEISFSHNFITGVTLDKLFNKQITVEYEAFYKYRSNLISSYDKTVHEEYLKIEDGYAAGFDLLMRNNEGPLTGWIGYSYLRSVKLNKNYSYLSTYDRTHSIKIILNYQLSKSWKLNSFWTYASGLPFTPIIAKYVAGPNNEHNYADFRLIAGNKNSDRFSAYHRLDIGVTGSFVIEKVLLSPYLQILNVYDSANPFIYRAENYNIKTEQGEVKGSYIVPTLGISIEF